MLLLLSRRFDLIDDNTNKQEGDYNGAHETANNHHHYLECSRALEPDRGGCLMLAAGGRGRLLASRGLTWRRWAATWGRRVIVVGLVSLAPARCGGGRRGGRRLEPPGGGRAVSALIPSGRASLAAAAAGAGTGIELPASGGRQ